MPPSSLEHPDYREENGSGYWGYPTATIDWCEENYTVTPYIAEFWNTVSNLAMILPALAAVKILLSEKAELNHYLSFLSLFVVGIGSWCFHMTLRYSMQLMDELPMLWGMNFIVYSLVTLTRDPNETNFKLIVGLISYTLSTSLLYLCFRLPVIFLSSYGVMVISMVIYSITTYRQYSCNRTLLFSSIITYFLGFVLWCIDLGFCTNIRAIRTDLPGFLGNMTQLHAWWHLFAGIGTYLAILFTLDARMRFLQKCPKLEFFYGILPIVRATDPTGYLSTKSR